MNESGIATANGLVTCDGWCKHQNVPTHIGNKGYVYCPKCAVERRESGAERTRKMRPAEVKRIAAGLPLERY